MSSLSLDDVNAYLNKENEKDVDDDNAIIKKNITSKKSNYLDINDVNASLSDTTTTKQTSSNSISLDDVNKAIRNNQTSVETKDIDDGIILPKPKPKFTQDQLIAQYSESHPAYFKDGVLIDQEGAEKAGILEVIRSQTDENSQINMPLPVELHTIRYRDKDELEKYKAAQHRLNMPLRYKGYVPVEKQTEMMLKQDLTNRPFMKKYIDVFGESGLNLLGHLTNTFKFVRGAVADGYQYVHEAIDEVTDGGASKTIQMSPKTAAKRFTGDLGAVLEVSEAAPFVRLTAGTVKSSQELVNQIVKEELKKKRNTINVAVKAEIIEKRKFNVKGMKNATQEASQKAKKKASNLAKKNLAIKEQLIKEFEVKIGARNPTNIDEIVDESKLISKVSAGRTILDPEKARKVGTNEAKKIYDDSMKSEVNIYTGKSEMSGLGEDLKLLGIDDSSVLTNPIVDADMLDPLVAVVTELKSKNPGAFGKGKTLIDDLFKLTVEKQLQASPELADLLAKYDLSYEKFMLAVIGSGSAAGKALQKFAQMKKATKPMERMEQLKLNKKLNDKSLGWKYFLRAVNIGRGAMVSQIATMMRNIRSAFYRAPMEGLGDVMDNTLYQMGDIVSGKGSILGAAYRGANEFFRPTNWKNSFKHLKYMYDDVGFKNGDIKEFTDWILDRPEFADEFNRLFNTLNEIQTMTGRGQATSRLGKGIDALLSAGEDLVDFLNIPNRWQEHIIRRSYFTKTLENLVEREYGLNLIDELKKGRLKDFMSNSSKVKPANARNFEELITDSVENALKNTYAARPEFKPFAKINNFITRSGLTVVVAFPRFMFSSMELMAKYTGGALFVPMRRALGLVGGLGMSSKRGVRDVFSKLDATDRDLITKNLVGLGALYGFMEYDKSKYSHPDYTKIRTGDGKVLDSTPEFPIRQFRHIARIGNQFLDGWSQKNGTATEKWAAGWDRLSTTNLLSAKELAETFLGANLRQGREFSVIEDFAFAIGDGDITTDEKIGKLIGSPLGNFIQRYVVPFGMVIDAERALGLRTDDMKEYSEETDLTFYGSLEKSFLKPFKRRGFISPTEEANLEDKVYAFDRDGKKRVAPELKVLFGLSQYEDDPPPADFFQKYGFDTFGLSSKAGSVIVRNRENRLLSLVLPSIAEVGKTLVAMNEQLDSNDPEKLNTTDLRKKIRNFIQTNIREAKREFGNKKYYYEENEGDSPETQNYKVILGQFEKSLTAFRRTAPVTRVEAVRLFRQRMGRDVVLTPTYQEDIYNQEGEIEFKAGERNIDLDVALNLEKKSRLRLFKRRK